jgi:hypothetical protein
MVDGRDRRYKIHGEDKRRGEGKYPAPPIAVGADAWQQGDIRQLSLKSLQSDAGEAHQDESTTPSPLHIPR